MRGAVDDGISEVAWRWLGATESERWRRGLARIGRGWGGLRFGEVYDRADGVPGESRVVLVKRLCYSEALRLGGTGAGPCVCEGVSCRGTVMPKGKRAEEAS